MTDFLPSDFKEPVTSNYMTIQDGDNVIRILDKAVVGWEYWTDEVKDGEKKAVSYRVQNEDVIPMDKVNTDQYGNANFYYFWAFPVYNFGDRRIQILKIRQKSIRAEIFRYMNNKKWGNPMDYNLIISKGKEGGKVKYAVTNDPKEPLDLTIIARYQTMHIDMNAWMEGKDPFASLKVTAPTSEPEPQVVEEQETFSAEDVADKIPF